MSKSDYDIFFGALKKLHGQALDSPLPRNPPNPPLLAAIDSLTPRDAPQILKTHYSSAPPLSPKRILIQLPYPTSSISICRLLPIFDYTDGGDLKVQLNLIQAKGAQALFIMRFDPPHPLPGEDYFHAQFSRELIKGTGMPARIPVLDVFDTSVPAFPIPANDMLTLLMSTLLTLYRSTTIIDWTSLATESTSKDRLNSAYHRVKSRCCP